MKAYYTGTERLTLRGITVSPTNRIIDVPEGHESQFTRGPWKPCVRWSDDLELANKDLPEGVDVCYADGGTTGEDPHIILDNRAGSALVAKILDLRFKAGNAAANLDRVENEKGALEREVEALKAQIPKKPAAPKKAPESPEKETKK